MVSIRINKKDDMVMKIIHFFITEENYKPIILKGAQNEIWLENFDNDLKLIRINTNYIHNEEQFSQDLFRTNMIRKNIGKKTFSFRTPMLNILIDANEDIKITDTKRIATLKIDNINDVKKNETLVELFPSIKKRLITKKSDLNEFIKLSTELNEKTFQEEKKLDRIFKDKKSLATITLIGINVGIFLLMLGSSFFNFDLYKLFMYYGANNSELIQSTFPIGLYRLVTSMFMHADIFHIGFNMYALYIIGTQVERYYGRKKFLIIYFISGIVGSLFSSVFMDNYSVSIGASGAIFGLFGALAYFAYNYRSMLGNFLKGQIIPVILINLVLGFLISGIDVSAHVGGLIAGILVSSALGVSGKEKKKTSSINSWIVLILLIIFMGYMLITK